MDTFILRLQDDVKRLEHLISSHLAEHPLEHHDHLMDVEEHAAHHAELDKPKEKRQGERRGGAERRQSTEKYEGEERRAG